MGTRISTAILVIASLTAVSGAQNINVSSFCVEHTLFDFAVRFHVFSTYREHQFMSARANGAPLVLLHCTEHGLNWGMGAVCCMFILRT